MKLSRYECPNCYQPLTVIAGPDDQNSVALSCMNFKCHSLACDVGGHGEGETEAYVKLNNGWMVETMESKL